VGDVEVSSASIISPIVIKGIRNPEQLKKLIDDSRDENAA
jgi:hypothetical protein